MEVMNLLADVSFSLIGNTYDISLNWIGRIVKFILSSGVGVGLGVILFSLILKVIVLPFDVFQRISMRKQNITMKENKEKMEKLQKQYANDKRMYNQKLMEMQKQSGLNLLSSCLPMILSLVIFFIAIGAFNAYAKFSAVDNYNQLVRAYRDGVKEYVIDTNAEDNVYYLETEEEQNYIVAKEEDKIIYLRAPITPETAATLSAVAEEQKQATLKTELGKITEKSYQYRIDVAKAQANEEIAASINFESEDYQAQLVNFFNAKGAKAAETEYEDNVSKNTKFLWVKNIWAVDASYKHPVLSHEDFLKEIAAASCGSSCSSNGKFLIKKDNGDEIEISISPEGSLRENDVELTDVYEKDVYNKVTANLGEQKDQANGYFILIVLSIGTILLQQFIMMHSQKEQQKYSSVDGQAASTQKMTMIIMTIMFGVFSFMYSSAFSIYMITSNLFSLGSTLLINKCVDVAEHKKEQKALQEKYNMRLPRNRQNNNNGKGKNNKRK